jgi:hypothetical protein
MCTPSGWICNGTGGSSGTGGASGGAGGSSGGSVDAASGCDPACTSSSSGTWCTAPTIEWVCGGGYDRAAFVGAGCTELATNAIRYCCPASFQAQCHD